MCIRDRQYFGKDASQLTLAESATLASIPRSPVAYSPYSNPEKLLERRNWVLGLMLDQERISQADYDAAAAAPLGVRSREEAAAASPRGKVDVYKRQRQARSPPRSSTRCSG